MDQILQVFFNAEVLERIWPLLARGLGMTAALSAVIVPLGVASGLAVALLYHLHLRWLNRIPVGGESIEHDLPGRARGSHAWRRARPLGRHEGAERRGLIHAAERDRAADHVHRSREADDDVVIIVPLSGMLAADSA